MLTDAFVLLLLLFLLRATALNFFNNGDHWKVIKISYNPRK